MEYVLGVLVLIILTAISVRYAVISAARQIDKERKEQNGNHHE